MTETVIELDDGLDLLTDEHLILLSQACTKLRSINTKKGELRKDYVQKFYEFHDIFIKVFEIVETNVNEYLLEHSDQKRGDVLKSVIKTIRDRQEALGIEKYLFNQVKFGFLKNIVTWLRDSDLLEKISTYRPRTKKGKDIDKIDNLNHFFESDHISAEISIPKSIDEPLKILIYFKQTKTTNK